MSLSPVVLVDGLAKSFTCPAVHYDFSRWSFGKWPEVNAPINSIESIEICFFIAQLDNVE